MATTSSVLDESKILLITRAFSAPIETVFDAWSDGESLKQWCAPRGFEIFGYEGEVRSGQQWHAMLKSPDGVEICAGGTFREIIPDQRIVFTHGWEDDGDEVSRETVVTVTFGDLGPAQTELVFCQGVFRTIELREKHRNGWREIFDRLETYLRQRPTLR